MKAVSAVSVLRRSPPADWPPLWLEIVSVQTCPGLQARDGCAVCIYRLKETDALTVADIRHAAPLISQRGAWQTESRIGDKQKSDGWKISCFVGMGG